MGILSAFRFAVGVTKLGGESAARPGGRASAGSPWSAGSLTKFAWSDILGADATFVTRAEAMKVPSIVKGRALIVGTLSRQPLAKFRGAAMQAPDSWMYRTNTDVSPQVRMLWTLDDIIFGGSSLWAVERGAGNRITDAVRVPPEWWEVTPDLEVLVNGQSVGRDEVLLFEGPQDGLLEIAADTIRAARAMERAWSSRVETPVPLVELHMTDASSPLEDDEADALIAQWEGARKRGGTALTPAEIEVKTYGDTPIDLFIQGRNALRLDVANYLALPAALLDGSTATASLTYSTKETSRNELVDLSLSFWATPIEARLSQDDVVPRGQRTAFDLSYLTTPIQPAQGPSSED
ncbi:MAG: phage portal protein [Cellulomonas sp.]